MYSDRTEESRYRLAAIVESADDAIASKTLEGVITSWNRGAEKLFGYSAQEIIGRHVTVLFPPDRIPEEQTILDRIQRGQRIEHYETERIRKDGTSVAVALTISPIRNDAGEIIGASKIARDITEQKRRDEERETLLKSEQAARAAAERAGVLKDEFLATLSHELRTPLNAILGWAQVLTTRPDELVLREGLEAIERNARAQTQLIADLLDMSRIVSGRIRLDVQLSDMTVVIDAALDAVRPMAQAKNIRLRKIIDPLAGPVSGDPTRLQQIIWNLLSNAIKFTPKDGSVDLLLERVNSHLELTVHDTGMGIHPDFLPFVFERFRQADSSATRSFGGLGLGLSIVKHLVELHGGSVRVKSAGEGQGATFIVCLPVAPFKNKDNREHPEVASGPQMDCDQVSLEGIRVLLVDDDPDTRSLLRQVLSQCKAEVHVAESAKDGMRCLSSFRPDVLISDIGMPNKDGYQFLKELRRRPREDFGAIPAIALTAFARSEDRTRAMMAGYNVHIAKPIEPQELLATVHSLAARATSR